MASTYYAWTRIYQQEEVVVERGAKVTPRNLGITPEQFEQHVSSGAFRTEKFPESTQEEQEDEIKDNATQMSLAEVLDSEPRKP